MKFTVERIALQRMVEQLKIERGVKGQNGVVKSVLKPTNAEWSKKSRWFAYSPFDLGLEHCRKLAQFRLCLTEGF